MNNGISQSTHPSIAEDLTFFFQGSHSCQELICSSKTERDEDLPLIDFADFSGKGVSINFNAGFPIFPGMCDQQTAIHRGRNI